MTSQRRWLVWVLVLGVGLFGAKLVRDHSRQRQQLSRDYSQLLSAVEQDKVEEVRVLLGTPYVLYQEQGGEAALRVVGPGDVAALTADLSRVRPAASKLRIQYVPASPWREAGRWALIVVPVVLVLLFIYAAFIRQLSAGNSQAMAFARSRARRLSDHMPRKTFDDVAGVDEAKDELLEIVDFLRYADKYRRLGAEIPKGVLLMGPPGCGKTLLARAVAGEADVPFFHISGSDFVEMFVGVGASRVRDLFEQAKAHRPCIVFIDELDAVGRHRGAGLGGGHDEREQTVNQLLVEMDGFEPNTGIIVMAATNRPDILDPALLRPGRFDRHVVVDHPDVRGRREILALYLKAKPVAPDVDVDLLARRTPGLTGADLYSMANEASIMAARSNRSTVTMADFEEAIERVVMGRERRSRVLLPSERRAVAYHEAGHAIIAWFHPHCTPLHKISILPRGMALGYVMTLPDEERHSTTLAEIKGMMIQLLGGRAAEDLVFGQDQIGTGAQNDLERVTELARAIVCDYGMSEEVGPRTLGRRHGPVFLGRDIAEDRNYSEHMAQVIDQEIRELVDDSFAKAQALLIEKRAAMERLVEVLLQHETLNVDELAEVLGPAPPKSGTAAEGIAAEVETGEPA